MEVSDFLYSFVIRICSRAGLMGFSFACRPDSQQLLSERRLAVKLDWVRAKSKYVEHSLAKRLCTNHLINRHRFGFRHVYRAIPFWILELMISLFSPLSFFAPEPAPEAS